MVVPLFVNFIGDSKSQHQLGAHSIGCKIRQCRKCLQKDCSFCLDQTQNKIRSSEFMQNLGRMGADVMDQIFVERTSNNKIKTLKEHQRKTLQKLKEYNIRANRSLLYSFTDWGEKRKIPNYCFHNSLDVDYLHTLLKGSIENIVSYLLLILNALSRPLNQSMSDLFKKTFFKKNNKINSYCNSMNLMSDRMATFPIHHTLLPFQFTRINDISTLLKSDISNTKKGSTTGFISGDIRASALPGILMELMFCIGLNGLILPNSNIISSNGKTSYNPTEVFMTAACSSLEVVFFSKAKELARSQVDVMSHIIFNSRSHLQKLFSIKQDMLLQFGVIKTPGDNHRGIKSHLLQHIPEQILAYGANPISFDTQFTELSHKQTSKTPWEISSKQTRGGQHEMLMIVARREHAAMLCLSLIHI